MDVIAEVSKIIQHKIEDVGYILDEVLYEREDDMNFLRIVIDKNGVVDIDDCVVVSNLINPILDEADLIEESYILDVCSKEKGRE